MPVTAREIAVKLGLSQPTVSRILNGTLGYRVAPDTKERVLQAAVEMDYRPNAVARALRRRRTNIIGFYSGYATIDARHDFIGSLVGGLQAACSERGMDILLHGGHGNRSPEEVANDLLDGRVDGLCFHGAMENPLIALLADSHLPVIALVDMSERVPSVIADCGDGMDQLVAYLWSKGHRCIAFLRPEMRLASVELRVRSFQQAMLSRGASPEEAPIYKIALEGPGAVIAEMLAATPRPSAVCCWNDRAAYNVLWKCLQDGVDVPGDLAIAGFDGFRETKLPFRSLTTVSVPFDVLTETSVALMMQHVDREPIAELTTVPVSLLPGDTA